MGDESSLLGLDATSSYTEYGIVYGNGTQISMGGWETNTVISASGSASDLTPFLGSGDLQLAITPFANTSSTGAAFAGITEMRDIISLSVTYVDPTPEPRWAALVAIALLGAAAFFNNRRKSRTS